MNLTDLLGPDAEDVVDTKLAKEARSVKASMLPGRDEVEGDIHWGDTGAIDHILQGRSIEGSETTSIRALTDSHRKKGALQLPVEAGTRVSFVTNLGSVLSYADIPDAGVVGTVVTVRSAAGDVTAYNGHVHVLWDDGKFRPILAEHLRRATAPDKRASSVRMRFSNLGDLSGFFEPALDKTASGSDLIHKATKDLWSFRREGGDFVIERLFTEDGKPLKV